MYSLRRYFLSNLPLAVISFLLTSVQAYVAAGGINLLQTVVSGISAKAQLSQPGAAPAQPFVARTFLFHEDLRKIVQGVPENFSTRLLVNGTVVEVLLISIGLMALATGLRFSRDFLRGKVNLRLRHQLREDLLDGLIGEPADTRRQRPEGMTAEIFRSDVDTTAQLIVFGVLSSLESLYLVAYFSFQVSQVGGWYIIPIFFFTSIASLGGVQLLTRRPEQNAMAQSYASQQNAASQTNRFFSLFSELLARGGEKKEGQRVVSAWDLAALLNTRFGLWAGARGATGEALQHFVMPVVLISIVLTEPPGPRMMGAVVAVPALLAQIGGPLAALISTPSMLIQFRPGLKSVTRLLGFLKQNAEPAQLADLKNAGHPAEVVLQEVTLVLGSAPEPILQSIQLTIPPGKRVGLIGRSGSGKTTLGRILAGEQMPSHGRVLIDGVDVTEWPFAWRRQLIGLLYAEPKFLIDSLRANICFGRELPQKQWENACAASGVNEIAAQKPQGWEEPITPEVQLSSGEKRKFGLARLLASVYPYRALVLDEPFANLDAEGIRDLARRVAVATEGITSLIITHDPDVIQTDFNVFLKNGRIHAIGTHEELMNSNADYAHLVARGSERVEQGTLATLGT